MLVTYMFSFSHKVFKRVDKSRFCDKVIKQSGNSRKRCWHFLLFLQWLYLRKMNVFCGILFIPLQKKSVRGYTGITLSIRLCVSLSFCIQNTSNFVLRTSTDLLLFYREIFDTLIIILKFSIINSLWFKSYRPLNLKNFLLNCLFLSKQWKRKFYLF